jgi:hypothetical protein
MEKTDLKEKPKQEEVVTFSYLQNRRVKVLPCKRPNQWRAKYKVEQNGSEVNDSGFMFPQAVSYFTVPLDKVTGNIKRVLDNTTPRKTVQFPNEVLTEQQFFERVLGYPQGYLDPMKWHVHPDGTKTNESYWKKLEGAVKLRNESIELDLSKPEEMIKYKVIESLFTKLIAPSMKEQNRKQSYRYVVMDIDQVQKEESFRLELELKAIDEFNRINNDIQKMNEILWMKDNKISESTNISYVKGQCYKFAKEQPSEFIAIVQSPYREVKLILLQAIKKGVITRSKEQTYRLRDGYDIGTMDNALKWLKNPENFDRVELIKDQIKLM